MRTDVEYLGDYCVIHIESEVDLFSADSLKKTLLDMAPTATGGLVVELSGVTYMDSSGISALLEGMRAAKNTGILFILVDLSSAITNVLDLARYGEVFDIRDSLEDL